MTVLALIDVRHYESHEDGQENNYMANAGDPRFP